jgi:hypothetical protein
MGVVPAVDVYAREDERVDVGESRDGRDELCGGNGWVAEEVKRAV